MGKITDSLRRVGRWIWDALREIVFSMSRVFYLLLPFTVGAAGILYFQAGAIYAAMFCFGVAAYFALELYVPMLVERLTEAFYYSVLKIRLRNEYIRRFFMQQQ